MDWSNEPYVRMYTRETDDDLALSWEALCVWRAMLLKFDRSGVIETRRGARGLAAVLRAPFEVVERALPELLSDGRIVQSDAGYLAPNFITAQEATKSDKLRAKESRERRRSRNLVGDVTKRDANVTSGHTASHGVTLTSADPLQGSALHGALSEASSPPEPEIPHHLAAASRSRPDPDQDLVAPLLRTAAHGEAVGSAFRALWAELNELRAAIAGELGLADVWPVSTETKHAFAFQRRLRAAGDVAAVAAQARHVLAVLAAEARVTRSVQWLSDVAFSDGVWDRAMRTTPADAKREALRAQNRDRDAEPPKVLRFRAKTDDDMPPLMPAITKKGVS
jgi:hypothetical protein